MRRGLSAPIPRAIVPRLAAITFRTEDGLTLEGELREPDGTSRGTAVVCHPHPQFGGSKDHPLLWAIRNDLAGRRGLTVLGFNFRGVMGSEGTFGGGRDEGADVAAAVDRAREEAGGPTVLAGWSFGAAMALRHAVNDDRIAVLACVALPLGEGAPGRPPLPTIDELSSLRMPVILMAGDRDRFCPAPDLATLGGWIPRVEIRLFQDVGHFFHRREREAAEAIGEFVDVNLGNP